ncbi:DUF3306 domain-containing protein [Bradyrhizobium genosp. A]|uniref:DUF3306 domain-containing protein n=1 Tax=Bradyrhizobium genosp. A TaxID=83626 RepID=UPI003CEB07A4
MTEADNVFLRWARLKQQASKVARTADGAPDRTDAVVAQTDTETADNGAFDLASLPSIESITADTDIVAFLRSEVPAELTRTALRRAWASDPSIRDFIGIAENQWDFNDPGAIPGFGPLAPMEDGADALAQISARFEKALSELAPPGDSVSPPETYPSLNAAEVRGPDPKEIPEQIPNEMPATNPQQGEDRLPEDYHAPGTRRRHGGALPR